MSNHDNHRRDETKRTEHGSRWEGDDCSKVASRARAWWKRLKNRTRRRIGRVSGKFNKMKPGREGPLPPTDEPG